MKDPVLSRGPIPRGKRRSSSIQLLDGPCVFVSSVMGAPFVVLLFTAELQEVGDLLHGHAHPEAGGPVVGISRHSTGHKEATETLLHDRIRDGYPRSVFLGWLNKIDEKNLPLKRGPGLHGFHPLGGEDFFCVSFPLKGNLPACPSQPRSGQRKSCFPIKGDSAALERLCGLG